MLMSDVSFEVPGSTVQSRNLLSSVTTSNQLQLGFLVSTLLLCFISPGQMFEEQNFRKSFGLLLHIKDMGIEL